MRSRAGQVTLFVIIGLVLLLIVALFIFMRQSSEEVEPSKQTITHDFSAVKATYEREAANCLKEEGKRVLKQVFAHGGFLDPEKSGFVALQDHPTRGSALPLGPDYKVPYWLDMRSPAGCRQDCTYAINIPPLKEDNAESLPSIEGQVEQGVSENIRSCLESISFSQDYDVDAEDDLSVDVTIGDGTVRYELDRTVNFVYTPTGANMTVEEASARQDVAAKELYESVRDVMSFTVFQNKSDTVHHAVKHVIEAYSMGRDPELPPIYGGTKFEVRVDDIWTLPDVKDALELRLADNLPLIQVPNTADRSIVAEQNHYSQAIYHTGVFKPVVFFDNPQYASHVAFHFMYKPEWSLDLQIGPGNGYLIKPQGAPVDFLQLLPGFGIHDYSFTYDVVAPMMLVADDPRAFDGEGLSFLVGFESGLVGNEPLLYAGAPVSEEQGPGDLFSAEDQRMDGDITLNVTDAVSGGPVEGVSFTYSCGAATSEVLDFSDVDGTVTTSLPFCVGGELTGQRDGYYIEPVQLDVLDDSSRTIEIDAYPLKEFELRLEGRPLFKKYSAEAIVDEEGQVVDEFKEEAEKLKKHDINPQSGIWEVGTEPFALRPDDRISLGITRQTESGEKNDVQVKMVNFTNKDSLTVELAKGEYDVEAYVITQLGEGHQRERVYIPEDKITWDTGLFSPSESETLEPVEFNESLYRGGIRLTGDRALEVTADDYDEEALSLKYVAVRISDLEKHLDLGILGETENYAKMYNDSLQPAFVSEEPQQQPVE